LIDVASAAAAAATDDDDGDAALAKHYCHLYCRTSYIITAVTTTAVRNVKAANYKWFCSWPLMGLNAGILACLLLPILAVALYRTQWH